MIKRFTLPEMGSLWTDLHKKTMWFKAELAGLWAKAKHGDFSMEIYNLARKVKITEGVLARADEIEKKGDHDLIAFVLAVTELLNDLVKPFFHTGFTSFDIEDTALALILRDCLSIILTKLRRLRSVLLARAIEHRYTLQIGRTHFIHAEPITFGFKLLGWVDVLDRHIIRLESLRKEIAIGKFSGAVGMYTLDPEIERLACKHLRLRPAMISTQIISRDILGHYAATLAGIANSLDRFATEIRHLAGTDISEVAEFKRPGAKGSSAMPGKSMLRNPIKSENTCGLARVSRGYLIPAFECEVTWGERTLENSAAERVYLPDLSITLDFMLNRFAEVMEKLEVFPAQMERNIWRTGGIVFSQRVMIKLTEKGMHRDQAYDLLEALALSVERGTFTTANGESFKDLAYANNSIAGLLSCEELDECFDPKSALKHIDEIFSRFAV
ncbi:MAG: adenylosuccinate lyase [Patescibacteria group bacterium]|nr:adenylosuccinate lyase [Patescibacteria group bacterium]MDD5294372.1 adenylosuccinate lyase [Patescibacteria group bacterium]MDD5554184.1 adenylosuccinate lyase [Patescibacteria group bacterium]